MFLKLNFTSYHFPPSIKSGWNNAVARDDFFSFWSSKRNHFPGNANQSVSPSFKDYFHELSGVTRRLRRLRSATAKALVQKLQIWLLTNFFGFILFLQDGVSENSILWLDWSHKKVISTKFMICWHMSNYIYSIQLFDEFCDCFLNLDCNNSSLFNLQKSLLIICIIFLLLCWKRK